MSRAGVSVSTAPGRARSASPEARLAGRTGARPVVWPRDDGSAFRPAVGNATSVGFVGRWLCPRAVNGTPDARPGCGTSRLDRGALVGTGPALRFECRCVSRTDRFSSAGVSREIFSSPGRVGVRGGRWGTPSDARRGLLAGCLPSTSGRAAASMRSFRGKVRIGHSICGRLPGFTFFVIPVRLIALDAASLMAGSRGSHRVGRCASRRALSAAAFRAATWSRRFASSASALRAWSWRALRSSARRASASRMAACSRRRWSRRSRACDSACAVLRSARRASMDDLAVTACSG